MAVQLSKRVGTKATQPLAGSPAYDAASPAAVRQAFLQSAIPESIPLTPLTGLGSQRQLFDIQMTGLCPYIRILVHAKVTVTGGAAGDVTVSNGGPHALFENTYFADPVGIPRIDLPPIYMKLRRQLYQNFGLIPENSGTVANTTQLADWTPVWQTPTAIGVNDWFFWWDMPLSVHKRDLQGMVDLSTPGRKARLGVTLQNGMTSSMAPAAGTLNDTLPCNIKAASAAAVALTSINIMAQQYIYGLQGVVNGRMVDLPIPEEDMAVIHVHEYTTGPIFPGRETYQQLPINRTYITAIQRWFFNNQNLFGQIDGITARPDSTAITKAIQNVRFKYSGNKLPVDEPLASELPYIFDKYGLNWQPGCVPTDWRDKPWNSDWTDMLLLGALLDPAAAGGANSVVETYTEGLYTGSTSDTTALTGAST